MEISKKGFLKLPLVPAVYTFWKGYVPIYIGKSVNLKSRLNSYLLPDLGIKTKAMIKSADSVTYIEVNSELESLLLESSLIKRYKPKYNVILKDDKNPLYILITKDKFPRVITSRKFGDYGPFPNTSNVRSILKIIRKIFPFSDHKAVTSKISKKPCLYSHLGLCSPCPNIGLNRDIYLKNIRNIKLVLSRKFNIVRKSLVKEMNKLSKLEKYEEAKVIRDKIKMLDYITQKRIDTHKFLENPNLVEDIRSLEIENLKALLNENCKLQIENLRRIECFDVSHLAGVSATASMVVLIDGEKDSSEYRHFRIRQKKTQSDYDSMREVVNRRLKNLNRWDKPDLIIVDGGLGQLKIFSTQGGSASGGNDSFEKLGIPVVGIAKNPDRLVFPDGRKVRLQGETLQLLSRIRDEAHRFARRYHHLLMNKNLLH